MTGNQHWYEGVMFLVLLPCAVIRFTLFAPLGYFWAHGSAHWNLIKNQDVLHNGLYDPAIAVGEKLASEWGAFAFCWNIAVWIPTFLFPPPLNLPFTIMDTVTTVYLARATHYQTGYVPHTKGSCSTAAYDWHRPAGANESFFEAAGRLNGTAASPVKMCRVFVEEWQYGIVVSFFYALISLLNIIAFFEALKEIKSRGEFLRVYMKDASKLALAILLAIPKIIMLILVAVLWYLPKSCFRCLPSSIKSKVRVGRRYALKSGLGVEQKAELGITELKDMYKQSRRKKGSRYQGGSGEASPLSNFLGIYDILIIVSGDLHYSDILNLSRVSKSVRESVLPAHDFDRRIIMFQRYSCSATTKTFCWICHKQMCDGCQKASLIPQVTLFHHLHHCRPYCTHCYQTAVVEKRPYSRKGAPHCSCAPVTARPNIFMRWWKGNIHYTTRQVSIPKLARAVCAECNALSVQQLTGMREKKTKMELKKGLKYEGGKWTKCAREGCSKNLGAGPRWWVCSLPHCLNECKSNVHQSWAREEKGDGMIVGEEVV